MTTIITILPIFLTPSLIIELITIIIIPIFSIIGKIRNTAQYKLKAQIIIIALVVIGSCAVGKELRIKKVMLEYDLILNGWIRDLTPTTLYSSVLLRRRFKFAAYVPMVISALKIRIQFDDIKGRVKLQ